MKKSTQPHVLFVPESGKTFPHPPSDPVRVDRRRAAELVTERYFPVSHRTIEAWPLLVRHVNGKATVETTDLFAHAQALLDAAPKIRGGRSRARLA
jgi:hypothetical protein